MEIKIVSILCDDNTIFFDEQEHVKINVYYKYSETETKEYKMLDFTKYKKISIRIDSGEHDIDYIYCIKQKNDFYFLIADICLCLKCNPEFIEINFENHFEGYAWHPGISNHTKETIKYFDYDKNDFDENDNFVVYA